MYLPIWIWQRKLRSSTWNGTTRNIFTLLTATGTFAKRPNQGWVKPWFWCPRPLSAITSISISLIKKEMCPGRRDLDARRSWKRQKKAGTKRKQPELEPMSARGLNLLVFREGRRIVGARELKSDLFAQIRSLPEFSAKALPDAALNGLLRAGELE